MPGLLFICCFTQFAFAQKVIKKMLLSSVNVSFSIMDNGCLHWFYCHFFIGETWWLARK